MTVNELLGLPADATQDQLIGRVHALAQTEGQLFKATGKDSVADAIAVIMTGKDAVLKLAAAEKELAEWQEHAAVQEKAKSKAEIARIVAAAVKDKHIGLSADDFAASLAEYGEAHGVEKLRAHVATYPNRVRHIQAPIPVNTEEQALAEYNALKAANPGIDPVTAGTAAAQRIKGGR